MKPTFAVVLRTETEQDGVGWMLAQATSGGYERASILVAVLLDDDLVNWWRVESQDEEKLAAEWKARLHVMHPGRRVVYK